VTQWERQWKQATCRALIQSSDGLGFQRQLGYDALNRLVQTLDNYNGSDTATQNTSCQINPQFARQLMPYALRLVAKTLHQ
jgi:YD repeat-containing protein